MNVSHFALRDGGGEWSLGQCMPALSSNPHRSPLCPSSELAVLSEALGWELKIDFLYQKRLIKRISLGRDLFNQILDAWERYTSARYLMSEVGYPYRWLILLTQYDV